MRKSYKKIKSYFKSNNIMQKICINKLNVETNDSIKCLTSLSILL